jgi:hypothetical protein
VDRVNLPTCVRHADADAAARTLGAAEPGVQACLAAIALPQCAMPSASSGRLPLGAALARGPVVEVVLEGRPVTAHLGETVATVLLAEGHAALRWTVSGSPRGIHCGMGVCFDCLVVVDGVPNTRACTTSVAEGMEIARQAGYTAVAGQGQQP